MAEAERIATSLSQPKKRGRDDPYDWDDDTTEPQVKAKRAKKVASQSQAKSQAASVSFPFYIMLICLKMESSIEILNFPSMHSEYGSEQ